MTSEKRSAWGLGWFCCPPSHPGDAIVVHGKQKAIMTTCNGFPFTTMVSRVGTTGNKNRNAPTLQISVYSCGPNFWSVFCCPLSFWVAVPAQSFLERCFARSPVPTLMPAVGLVHGGRATGLVKPKQACGTSPQGGERCAAGAVLPSTESPEFEPSTPSTVSERSSPVSDHEEDKLGESAPNSHGPPKDKVAPDSSRVCPGCVAVQLERVCDC